jgi:hypothetical protein
MVNAKIGMVNTPIGDGEQAWFLEVLLDTMSDALLAATGPLKWTSAKTAIAVRATTGPTRTPWSPSRRWFSPGNCPGEHRSAEVCGDWK